MSDDVDIPYSKKIRTGAITASLIANTSSYVGHPELQPYYDLWTSVIKQAVSDVTGGKGGIPFFRSYWFIQICDMIDLDHMKVIHGLPKHIQDKVLKK